MVLDFPMVPEGGVGLVQGCGYRIRTHAGMVGQNLIHKGGYPGLGFGRQPSSRTLGLVRVVTDDRIPEVKSDAADAH